MIVFSLFLLGLTACSKESHPQTVIKSTPTIFFHGLGSSYHAEEHMINAAKRAGVTDSVIRAEVSPAGKVTLIGHWKKNAKNPIVEVNYENNHQLNFNEHGRYATNVVKVLQKTYGIKKMNMIGHSLGNISIIYYMLRNGQNRQMPQLQKQVDIAGHFAGLRFKKIPKSISEPKGLKLNQDGKPNKMNASYRQMTAVRKIYPKGQVAVLNLIGDIGDHTDGTVSNASSLSLKYLVAKRAKSYQVITFHGKKARHSSLHHNSQVDRALIKFLWHK